MNLKISLNLLLLCFFSCLGYGQTLSFDSLLSRGKAEFRNDSLKGNYELAIRDLTTAIGLRPDNAEAHYFLGYAYSRLNSNSANNMSGMKLSLVLRSSEEQETVIKLTPKYAGEMIVLDPYSKITSEWGSMAMSFISYGKTDSAIWALKEGRKRGGFDDFILSENRITLRSCSKNSILITYGDNDFFPTLYLQLVEKFRTDVGLIVASMLNADWYPRMLVKNKIVDFDLKGPSLDTIDYEKWSDSTVSIPIEGTNRIFKWMVGPSNNTIYIFRGDKLLLSLLKENKFKRDIYFSISFGHDEYLNLENYLLMLPAVNKLNFINAPEQTNDEYIISLKQLIKELSPANNNAIEELVPIDCMRYGLIRRIELCLDEGDKKQATELLKILDTDLSEKKYLFYSADTREKIEKIREGL